MSAVPGALRRARILERIRRDGGVTVAELARHHAVSHMTAHRDLEQLARDGLVERVRGGARALDHAHVAERQPGRRRPPECRLDRLPQRARRRPARPHRPPRPILRVHVYDVGGRQH